MIRWTSYVTNSPEKKSFSSSCRLFCVMWWKDLNEKKRAWAYSTFIVKLSDWTTIFVWTASKTKIKSIKSKSIKFFFKFFCSFLFLKFLHPKRALKNSKKFFQIDINKFWWLKLKSTVSYWNRLLARFIRSKLDEKSKILVIFSTLRKIFQPFCLMPFRSGLEWI